MPKRSANRTKKRSYKKRQYKKGGAKGDELSESDYLNKEKAAGRPSRRQRSADLSKDTKERMRTRSPSPKRSLLKKVQKYFGYK